MSYQIKNYMTKEVNTINLEATVMEAVKTMAADKNYEGYVIILDKGKPVGIVTERDIINKVLAKELDPKKIKVSDIMSAPLITIDPDEDLLKASKQMQEQNIRKLIVVRNEIIYGIITAKDIAQRCGIYVDKSIRDIIRWTTPLGV